MLHNWHGALAIVRDCIGKGVDLQTRIVDYCEECGEVAGLGLPYYYMLVRFAIDKVPIPLTMLHPRYLAT